MKLKVEFLVLLVAIVFAGSTGSAIAQASSHPAADTLLQQIKTLRSSGRYGEAAATAVRYQALLQSDRTVMAWERADAGRLLGTLRLAAGLAESDRRELAAADSLLPVIEESYNKSEFRPGEKAVRHELEIRRRLLGSSHPEVAGSLNNLAAFLLVRADYGGAEKAMREALAIASRSEGADHPDVAEFINSIATLKMVQAKYAEAESLHRRAYDLHSKSLGPNHPLALRDLNNLGADFLYVGEYARAEALFRRVLAKRREVLGEKHPDVAVSAGNLASTVDLQGDHREAEALYREALSILVERNGEISRDVAISLNNLGTWCKEQGNFAAAESLFQRVMAVDAQVLGERNPDYALDLQNLADVRRVLGKLDDSEALNRRALELNRDLLGPEHPGVALTLNNLANCLADRGEFAAAEAMHRQSLALRRKTVGENHPDVLTSLNQLAALLRRRGADAAAESTLVRAARVFEIARLRAGSGASRATFEDSPYPALAAVRLSLGKPGPAWEAVERSQGRVLNDLLMVSSRRSLTRAEVGREAALLGQVEQCESQLEACRANASTPDTAGHGRNCETARTRLLEAEAALGEFRRRMAAEYPVTEGGTYSLARVQASLAPDAAILGWVEEISRTDSIRNAWVYVIRHTGAVRWARLQASGLRALGRAYRQAVSSETDPSNAASVDSGVARALYAARVAPIETELREVSDLVVIPSGGMLGLPLEALVGPGERYLGDRFRIHYCPSATLHAWLVARARQHEPWGSATTALFLGDPPFSAEQARQMLEESQSESASGPPAWVAARWQEDKILVGNLRGGSRKALAALPRLRGSRLEVEMARRHFGPNARVLLGPEASEQALVTASKSIGTYRILHLATHALVDDKRPENCALVLSQVDLPDPILAAERHERIYDGRWTAREILQEWRLNADLVVLSGCETALGREVPGEGYIGFAQAFLQAGARNLLLSLWEVDDRSTAMLMESFYRNLLGRLSGEPPVAPPLLTGGQIAEALRRAQREIREFTENGSCPYAHPRYWAGFVVIGASR